MPMGLRHWHLWPGHACVNKAHLTTIPPVFISEVLVSLLLTLVHFKGIPFLPLLLSTHTSIFQLEEIQEIQRNPRP